MIKKGDTVKCIGNSNRTANSFVSAGWEKDLEFIVTRITEHPPTGESIAWGGKYDAGVWFSHLKLVDQDSLFEELDNII